MDTTRTAPDVLNGDRNHTDTFSIHTDAYTVGNTTETPANKTENVRTRRNQSETRNSPETHGIMMPKPIGQWRNISTGDADVYIPLNVLIAAPSRKIIFEQFKSRDKLIVANIESEKAGDGGGG